MDGTCSASPATRMNQPLSVRSLLIRGMLVGMINSPASKLVRLLNTPGSQLARVLSEKSKQAEKAA